MSAAAWSTDLRTQLRSYLVRVVEAQAFRVRTAWQGRAFTPTPAVPWIRERLMPTGSDLRTVGARHGLISEQFLYLVDIFWPRTDDLFEVEGFADAIQSALRPGTPLGIARGGYVQRCSRSAILEEPNWMQLPVQAAGWIYRENV